MTTDSKLTNNAQAAAEKHSEKIEQRPVVAPAVDVFENENELLVVADLPGVAQDKIRIHFEKGRLTLEGQRASVSHQAGVREIEAADFRRTFLVPQGIDSEKISAELSQGVLTVHLPKHASVKARRIEVKAS